MNRGTAPKTLPHTLQEWKGTSTFYPSSRQPPSSPTSERTMAVLAALNESGMFNAAVREWDQKPERDKTWDNIKVFTCEEFTKAQK